MNDLAAQLAASERHRGQAAPGARGHVVGNSATTGKVRSRPIAMLIVSGIALIAAIVIGTAITILSLRDSALANSERELGNTALLIAKHAEHAIEELDVIQTGLIEDMRSLGNVSSEDFERKMSGLDVHQMLKNKISGLSQIDSLSLINSNGMAINDSLEWPIPAINVVDRAYFKALKSDAQLTSFVSEPISGRRTGNSAIVFARKITAPNGQFLGVVLGTIDLQYFENFFVSVILGDGSSTSLFRDDGTLLVRYPRIEPVIGRVFKGAIDALGERQRGTVRLVGKMDGKDRLLAAQRLEHFPLFVSVGVDVAVALANWRKEAIFLILLGGLAASMIAAMVFIIARQLLRGKKQFQRKFDEQERQLDTAISNMSQGLVMFDSAARLVVCNDRYRQIYNLSPDMTTPGCAVVDLLKHRAAIGTFSGNPEKYVDDLLATIAQGTMKKQEVATGDGRIISVVNQPTTGGGWVATHEDVTEKVRAKQLIEQKKLQLDVALNNMAQGLAMFDSSARLVVCNDRYLQMSKLSPDVATSGCTILDLLKQRVVSGTFSGNPEEFASTLVETIARGEVLRTVVETGEGRIISVVNQPMAGGGWVATHEDITEARRQEASFRLLFKNNPVPMWVFDRDSLRFLAVNEAAVAHYGYSHEQFQAMTVMDIRPIEERERFAKYAHLVGEDNNGEQIWRHQKSDNTKIDVAIYSRALSYDGHKAALVASIDVTERKRADNELRKTKHFLNTVVENAPLPIVVKSVPDMIEKTSEYRFTLINRAAEELFEVSRDQMIGKNAYEVYTKDHADFVAGQDIEALRANGPLQVREHTVEKSNHDIRFVTSRKVAIRDDNGRPEYLLSLLEDVTERKRAGDELRRTQAFLDMIVENMPTPIIVKDAHEHRYTLVNRATEECFGIPRNKMIGKGVHELFRKEEADAVVIHDNEALQSDRPLMTDTYPLHTAHNGTRLLTAKRLAVRDSSGNPQHILSVLEDVTERSRSEQRIAHMAHHDTLTDLPNRAAFNECLTSTFDRATTTGEPFAVMSIDLDRFKEVNDVFGHAVGDKLLREVALRLQATAGGAFFARLGGDEFSLIVADGLQPATASALADRLLAVVAGDFEIEGLQLRIGLSIGVAIYPAAGADAKTLMNNADAALYRAKAEARGLVRFFEPEMGAQLRERLALQNDLRLAIDRGELTVHYQPQMRMTGEPVGFEALLRWQCPKRGMVAPSTFIPIAEESSLILSIGEWVLREACREAASWPQPLTIAVNVSPIQFHHGDLPSLVHSILLETGLAPARLELEITEGVMINDFSRAVSILRRLKSLGVQIALDDFGTGYSSLSYLHSFVFDRIKIDRAFVCDLEHNRHSMAIVRAVISLGRSLNLPVLAEGVETEAQHAFLVREGCTEVQGYLTGRPLPIADYAKLVGRLAITQHYYATAS